MTTIAILRKRYEVPFVQIPREILIRTDMSWGAKGLLCYMLDKPDNWEFSIAGIVSQGKDRTAVIKRYIKELKQFGYLRISNTKDSKGSRYTGKIWEITAFSNNFSERSNSDIRNSDGRKTATSNTIKEKDSKEEIKENIQKKDATSADAYALCNFLLKEKMVVKPNFSGRISASWLKAAEKLLKMRPRREVEAVIAYMVSDPFMGPWTCSMAKILKHLDAAEDRMKAAGKLPPQQPETPPEFKKNMQIAQKVSEMYNTQVEVNSDEGYMTIKHANNTVSVLAFRAPDFEIRLQSFMKELKKS